MDSRQKIREWFEAQLDYYGEDINRSYRQCIRDIQEYLDILDAEEEKQRLEYRRKRLEEVKKNG